MLLLITNKRLNIYSSSHVKVATASNCDWLIYFSWILCTRARWQFCIFGALQWQAVDQRVIDCVQVTSWDLCCRSGVNHLTRKHRLQTLFSTYFPGYFGLNPSALSRVSQKVTLGSFLEILRPKF